MAEDSKSNFSKADAQQILLIGDIGKAFLDIDGVKALGCEVQRNMLDGINAAAKSDVLAIAVVMGGTSAKLGLALKALRNANSQAKIVLLAQMYEEPKAIQLLGTSTNGESVADDYLVCPIEARRFLDAVTGSVPQKASQASSDSAVGEQIQSRIKRLEELATTDELTGLKNRRYIWEFSRQILEHARTEDGRVTLLLFDIDNFKHYNDVYGHSAGDEILRQAAVLMQRSCRPHDVVGRIGGDEFAVIFWDDSELQRLVGDDERRSASTDHPRRGAIFIANRFRSEFNKAELDLLGPEGKGVLTISGGLASFPRDGSTFQALVEQADKALLDAKRSGKNRIYLVGRPQNDIADIQ